MLRCLIRNHALNACQNPISNRIFRTQHKKMATATGRRGLHRHGEQHPIKNIANFLQSTATNLSSLFIPKSSSSPPFPFPFPSNKVIIHMPLLFSNSDSDSPPPTDSPSPRNHSFPSSVSGGEESSTSSNRFPSAVKISGLNSNGKGSGGPAFVGQVFTMSDLAGTGLMAVSSHIDFSSVPERLSLPPPPPPPPHSAFYSFYHLPLYLQKFSIQFRRQNTNSKRKNSF